MQRRRRHLRIGIALFVLAGVAIIGAMAWQRASRSIPAVAWEALDNADTYEVFSIGSDMTDGGLDHYPFRGKTAVADPSTRAELNEALERSAREAKGWAALCFEPHHGIRVTRDGVTTDFVICFKCLHVQVWQGDNQIATFPTSKSAEPLFDRVLTQAGVALSPKSP